MSERQFILQNAAGKYRTFFTRMVLECFVSWLSLHTADEIIHHITIPWITEIVAAQTASTSCDEVAEILIRIAAAWRFDAKKKYGDHCNDAQYRVN